MRQVTWHLGSDVKQFMPRLGAPITSITPCAHDPAKFVITQANNTIRVVRVHLVHEEYLCTSSLTLSPIRLLTAADDEAPFHDAPAPCKHSLSVALAAGCGRLRCPKPAWCAGEQCHA